MAAAVLRHASPLLSIRAPIFAGLGAAGLFALGALVIAIFGNGPADAPSVRESVDPLPRPVLTTDPNAEALRALPDTIEFVDEDDADEASLAGVPDGFETPAEPAARPAEPGPAPRAEPPVNPNALIAAPIAGLTEPGPGGPLPIIGADGTRPSRAYARPFHGNPDEPTIAIVIGGMGLNAGVTQAAIDELPPEVALSFAPYTQDLQTWIDRARAAGHEVLIEAPMEPFDYPNNDPGPHTLLADGPNEENDRRLAWVLSRTTGYYGVTNYLGARFSGSSDALSHVMRTLERRGLAFLHDGAGRRSTIDAVASEVRLEYAIADRILDEDPSPSAIDDRLLALEALALQNGSALGNGFAYPATVDHVRDWANGLEMRGYQLAPPSAVMARRRLEARLAAEAEAHDAGPQEEVSHRWQNDGNDHGSDDSYGASADDGH